MVIQWSFMDPKYVFKQNLIAVKLEDWKRRLNKTGHGQVRGNKRTSRRAHKYYWVHRIEFLI